MSEQPLTTEQKAEQLKNCLRSTLDLLNMVSATDIAKAFQDRSINEGFEQNMETRKLLKGVFMELADDLEAQTDRLQSNLDTIKHALAFVDKVKGVCANHDFKNMMDTLERFASLMERIDKLRETGVLKEVLATVQAT